MCEVQLSGLKADWLTITPLDGRTGLRLAGEADLWSVPALRRAVEALPADARHIHLQLAGLEFIDVAAARFLITLTERPGQPDVILHSPPPLLIRLIRLLRPDGLAPFSVQGAESRHSAPRWRASSGSPGRTECGQSIPRWREGTAGGQA